MATTPYATRPLRYPRSIRREKLLYGEGRWLSQDKAFLFLCVKDEWQISTDVRYIEESQRQSFHDSGIYHARFATLTDAVSALEAVMNGV